MNVREAYQEKIQAQIDKFNAEFQIVEAEAKLRKAEMKESRADAALGFDNHLNTLKMKEENLKHKFKHMQDASFESWEELKIGVERAMKELEESFEKAKEHIQHVII